LETPKQNKNKPEPDSSLQKEPKQKTTAWKLQNKIKNNQMAA